MVGVSASVNLPLHHIVHKYGDGAGNTVEENSVFSLIRMR